MITFGLVLELLGIPQDGGDDGVVVHGMAGRRVFQDVETRPRQSNAYTIIYKIESPGDGSAVAYAVIEHGLLGGDLIDNPTRQEHAHDTQGPQ